MAEERSGWRRREEAGTTTSRVTRKASPEAARAERELLARLGLKAKASNDEVEAAHVELVKFLESAPPEVRRWAQSQIAAVDEAYALLSDPTIDVAAAGSAGSDTGRVAARQQRATGRSPLVRRGAIAAVAAAVIAFVVVVVYRSGGDSPAATAGGTTVTDAAAQIDQAQIDQAQVAQLMEKIAANPNDVASLVQLGDIFFQAGDYNVAGAWMQKAVTIDPKNVTARLALGAAQFNLGNGVEAERQWREVIAIDPENVEAYYDLGFLYLSRDPPDEASAREAWSKVIEIAPNSEVAKTVATHLKGLESPPASTTAPTTTSGE